MRKKQKNVENLKDQTKSIHEIVERELSDNKHAEYLWGLYNQKPTSQKKQDSYEHCGINVPPSERGYQQALGHVTDDEDLKGRPSDLNNETFLLIADFRNQRFRIEATLNAENRMEENINRELSNLKRNQEDQTKSLNKARHDLQSFKYSKQCKLNNLDAVLMVAQWVVVHCAGEIEELHAMDFHLTVNEETLLCIALSVLHVLQLFRDRLVDPKKQAPPFGADEASEPLTRSSGMREGIELGIEAGGAHERRLGCLITPRVRVLHDELRPGEAQQPVRHRRRGRPAAGVRAGACRPRLICVACAGCAAFSMRIKCTSNAH